MIKLDWEFTSYIYLWYEMTELTFIFNTGEESVDGGRSTSESERGHERWV